MSGDKPISRRDLFRGRLRPDPPSAPASPQKTSTRPDSTPTLVHRPPGAVDEPAFLAGCTRCGDCIDACPVNAITLAGPKYGVAAGTPMIDPVESPCVMCEDMPCIASCEPGVLSPERPLRMGTAKIVEQHCLAYMGTMCTVCSERCPVEDAIVVTKGRPAIVEQACTGCGVCQHVCPAPYNAVLVLPDERASSTPVEPESASGFDWRAEYFKGRSLRPPGGNGP